MMDTRKDAAGLPPRALAIACIASVAVALASSPSAAQQAASPSAGQTISADRGRPLEGRWKVELLLDPFSMTNPPPAERVDGELAFGSTSWWTNTDRFGRHSLDTRPFFGRLYAAPQNVPAFGPADTSMFTEITGGVIGDSVGIDFLPRIDHGGISLWGRFYGDSARGIWHRRGAEGSGRFVMRRESGEAVAVAAIPVPSLAPTAVASTEPAAKGAKGTKARGKKGAKADAKIATTVAATTPAKLPTTTTVAATTPTKVPTTTTVATATPPAASSALTTSSSATTSKPPVTTTARTTPPAAVPTQVASTQPSITPPAPTNSAVAARPTVTTTAPARPASTTTAPAPSSTGTPTTATSTSRPTTIAVAPATVWTSPAPAPSSNPPVSQPSAPLKAPASTPNAPTPNTPRVSRTAPPDPTATGALRVRIFDRASKKYFVTRYQLHLPDGSFRWGNFRTGSDSLGYGPVVPSRPGRYEVEVENFVCGDKFWFFAKNIVRPVVVKAGETTDVTIDVDVTTEPAKKTIDNKTGALCAAPPGNVK